MIGTSCDIIFTAQEAVKLSLEDHSVIVIDVFRATTSILSALEAGAASIIPVTEVAEGLARRAAVPGSLLCGEREGLPPAGFDMGNSPVAFSGSAVRGKTVILTTTNGTLALRNASSAGSVHIGCLRNAAAAARAAARDSGKVTILCAGTGGRYSIEDAYAAGACADVLRVLGFAPTDAAWSAVLLSRLPPETAVNRETCLHLRRLLALGFGRDVEYALERDVSAVVPAVRGGGEITA